MPGMTGELQVSEFAMRGLMLLLVIVTSRALWATGVTPPSERRQHPIEPTAPQAQQRLLHAESLLRWMRCGIRFVQSAVRISRGHLASVNWMIIGKLLRMSVRADSPHS